VAEKLNSSTGLNIDAHTILLPEPIREIGDRTVTIKFTRNISIDITVDVVPDEASKPVVAKLLADREAEAAALKAAQEAAAARLRAEAEEAEAEDYSQAADSADDADVEETE
jgi:hypothetical protein